MRSPKARANSILWNAIKEGLIAPARDCICERCGTDREKDPSVIMQYHHADYEKPLEVIPVCVGCHMLIHADLPTFPDNSSLQDTREDVSERVRRSWEKRDRSGYNKKY